ncbi:MAG TPA: NAD(P)/FAD-dependent oxidoreductase [Puia sp.]|nr:NAD(P)/FAD-dependent oxidoreductase [Puia sp.]
MPAKQTNTLIIGASISGLASAACLQKKNIEYVIIEKQDQVAGPWRAHYDRLHLHTSKRFSQLPYKKMGSAYPRYPSRLQVIEYLEAYQKAFDINPLFNREAVSVKKEGDHWITATAGGDSFRSKYLIMATGAYGKPKPIRFKGMETFPGRILHSYDYRSGKDFEGQRVLVVGFGNSACEIAIDLYEQGAAPSMSVRSPVNVISRDILGIPILEISLLLSHLSPRIADMLSAPVVRWVTGDLTRLGLKKLPYGPLQQIQKDGNSPVLDIGTLAHIRKGHIKIYEGIDHIEGRTVCFTDGRREAFDAIVAGIGYYRDYAEFVGVGQERFQDLKTGVDKQQFFGKDGLYFCGYWVSPTGQIREIALDAQKIARDIEKKERLLYLPDR